MGEATVTVFKKSKLGFFESYMEVKGNGEIHPFKVAMPDDAIVERAKLFQRIYSLTNPCIEEFCKKNPNINWTFMKKIDLDKDWGIRINSDFPQTMDDFHELICKLAHTNPSTISKGSYEIYQQIIDGVAEHTILQSYGMTLGVNTQKFADGGYSVRDYGGGEKYPSGLTFIIKKSDLDNYKYSPDQRLQESLNIIWDGTPTFMYGNFWIFPKGTKCFAPCDMKKAKHILIKVCWGGSFNSSRGREEIQKPLYNNRASSNGGGCGCSYYVVPLGYQNCCSVSEI